MKTVQATAAAHKLKEMKENVNSVQKGLDICFLVDCTGSMASHPVAFRGKMHGCYCAGNHLLSKEHVQTSACDFQQWTQMSIPVTCCSQGWCIEQVKSKVRSIINEVRTTHKDAIVNVVKLCWDTFKKPLVVPCSSMTVPDALVDVLRFFRLLWGTVTFTPMDTHLANLRYAHAPADNTSQFYSMYAPHC